MIATRRANVLTLRGIISRTIEPKRREQMRIDKKKKKQGSLLFREEGVDTGEALPGGQGSRWSKGAALCLGFSVVQQVSQTTSVQTASSPLAYHIYGASSTTLLKKNKKYGVMTTHPSVKHG